MSENDPFAEVCGHIQAAGSALAAALVACDRLPADVRRDPGTGGDLGAIRENLFAAARHLDRAERLAYPLPRAEEEPE